MNNFEDIQNLWRQSSPKNMVSSAEIIRQIKQQQRREKIKLLGGTLILILTFFFILFIAFYYRFAFISTQLGIALILLSIVAAVFMNSQMISLLLRNDIQPDSDNKMMLANMETYQEKQSFFQTRFMSAYYILLTAGLMLYMYELTRSSYLFMLIAYSLTLGWIAFAWWWLRPRAIRKQRERVSEIINHIKSLQEGMSEPG